MPVCAVFLLGTVVPALAQQNLPQVSIEPPTLAAGTGGHLFEIEGDPGSAEQVPCGAWVLIRTGDRTGELTVNLTVTETVGDFVPASNEGSRTVTFPDGDAAVYYRPIEDDSIKESHGTVTVAIAAGSGYEVDADNSSAAVAVRDDDFQMTLTVDPLDLTVVEGKAAQFYAVLRTNNTKTFTEADDVWRVMRLRGNDMTPGKNAPYSIAWAAISIEAVAPDDYEVTSTTLDVKASDFSAEGDGYEARMVLTPIQTVDDMEEEEPERFLAELGRDRGSIASLATIASRANIPDLQQNGEVVELSDSGSIRAVATITDPPLPASDDATLGRLVLTETDSGNGITLDPTFDPAVLNYDAQVPVGVETITLDAAANHADAALKYLNVTESELADADGETGGFQAGLMLGATVLKVGVEAEDGTELIYSLSVFRPGPPLSLNVVTAADDDVVNIREKANGFSIAGTVQDDKSGAVGNATVTVEIAGETLTAASGSDGTWSVDVPAAAEYIGEPSVTVTVNATKPPFLPAPEVAHTLTVDLTSPTLVSATAQYTRLELAYDEALATTDLPTSAFSVTVDGIVLSDDLAVSVADSSIALLLPSAVFTDDTVTVSYTPPAETDGEPIRDSADNPVKALTDHPVENITPLPPSDDATLGRLVLTETDSGNGITLDPTFDPAVLNYDAQVPVGVETITLDAAANDAGAALTYLNGTGSELADADGETDGFQAGLMLGATVLKVQVEAEDGTMLIYALSVFRPGPPLSLNVVTAADDDVVNIREKANGFSIAGTVQDDKSGAVGNATVTVEIAGETLTATSGSDGTWSVDVPAAAEYIGEPSVTVTVNATKPPFLPAPEVAHTLTVDLTSPTLVSATAQYTRLELAYDEALATTDLPTSAFSVTVDSIVFSDDIAVSVADSSIALLLPSAVFTDDTVTVSYTPPAETDGEPIRDSADNPVKALTDHPVENITPPGEHCTGPEGSMRLSDGSDAREGRVEVCADDDITDTTPARWGVVCDDYWTNDEADVVCKAVGHERSEPRAGRFTRSYFGAGTGPFWLDDLLCNGDETSLLDCPVANGGLARDAIGVHNCRVSETAGVRCMAAGDP